MTPPMDRVLSHFPDALSTTNGFEVRCPAHEDDTASLSIAEGRDGRVLINCKAGCSPEAVVAALGLTMSDLFNGPPPPLASRPRRRSDLGPIVATYEYRDESGASVYECLRFAPPGQPKDFRQRHIGPDGKWIWSIKDVRRVLFRLPELLAADPALPVYVVEGEKDVLRLVELGLVATTNPMGARKWRAEFNESLRGRQVIVLPDNDDPGRMHAREVSAGLDGIAASVRVIELPNLPPKGDVSDWLAAGGTREDLEKLVATPVPNPPTDERPIIEVRGGELHTMTDGAEAALIASTGPRIYQRGALVRAVRMPELTIRDGITRQPGSLMITVLDSAYLIERLTADAAWHVFDGRTKRLKPCDCPDKVARALLSRIGEWHVPTLIAIVEAPTLRPNGSLLATPGYDEESGLLFDSTGYTFGHIPTKPTAAQVTAGTTCLRDLVHESPFVADTDLSASVAAICTAIVRRSLPSAPMFGFRAPKMRSGKTMLADCVALVTTGRTCAVMSQAEDQAAEQKRLLGALMAGDSVLCYDNIDREFGGAAISQALTQATISDRILGQSRVVTVPTSSTFLATGNNLTFAGDITARVVPCDLDPQMEHPETRLFTRDLYEYIPKHRTELVTAALTVMLGYQAAGRPEQGLPAWAGFTAWSRMVREALVWAGFADPAGGRCRLEDTDPVRVQLSGLLTTWYADVGSEAITGIDAVNRSKSEGTMHNEDPRRTALRAALVEVAGDNREVINTRRLGKYILAHRNRIEDGLKFERIGDRNKVALWRVVEVGDRSVTTTRAEVESDAPRLFDDPDGVGF